LLFGHLLCAGFQPDGNFVNFHKGEEDPNYGCIPNGKKDGSFVVRKKTEKKPPKRSAREKREEKKSKLHLQFYN
jgi:hypothetical protein